jgi:O-antigen ligase
MADPAYPASGKPYAEQGSRINIYAALTIPALLSALVLLFSYKSGELLVCGAMLLFFAISIFLLTGNVFSRSIYIFFLIQFTVSFRLPLSLYVTMISLLFFPLALRRGAFSNELTAPPCVKPLLLLLSGWVVSLIYLSLNNDGELKYFFMYDISFLLGLAVAYEMFVAFRLKLLTPDKLIRYIALSGLVIVCAVLGKYIIDGGSPTTILSERLGSSVSVNPNIMTAYLDLALPCAFFTAFFEKRNFVKKIFFYLISLVMIFAIILAATRGSLPGIAILAAYVIWRKRSKLLLLGVLVCTAVIVFTLGARMAERLLSPNVADLLSNMGRVEMLRTALKILKENHYFFGIGMNNFSQMKFAYGFPQWFDTGKVMSSHNFFVEIWLGWGLLGLLGWLTLNAAVVISILRKHKDDLVANAVAFAVVAFSAHGLLDSMCANYSIMFTYFSLLGAAFFIMTSTSLKPDNE